LYKLYLNKLFTKILIKLKKTIDYRSSRNRTYIGNLEGFCPNPLDDGPLLEVWKFGRYRI
jgi:hypothetical protein